MIEFAALVFLVLTAPWWIPIAVALAVFALLMGTVLGLAALAAWAAFAVTGNSWAALATALLTFVTLCLLWDKHHAAVK